MDGEREREKKRRTEMKGGPAGPLINISQIRNLIHPTSRGS